MSSYTRNSPILAPEQPFALDALYAKWRTTVAGYSGTLWPYMMTVTSGAVRLGIDPVVMLAQWDLETNTGHSHWWTERRNPAGIGITGDAEQNAASQTWGNGSDAAFGHLAHMTAYLWGEDWPDHWPDTWPDPTDVDQRFGLAVKLQGGKARILADLNGTWAVDPENDYGGKLAARANNILAIAGKETEAPMAERPKVLVIAGHRNTSGGSGEEIKRTPMMAKAYRDVFRAGGYDCQWLQEIDGDADPDDTMGGLDVTSRQAAAWLGRFSGDLILLDLHFEGTSAAVRGLFAIAPNRMGLTTGAPVQQHINDVWEYNTLDRRLGRAIAFELSERTGIPVRMGLREPGVMDERATGVGGDGYRLATFAYTSPYQPRAVRLVIEHGNLPNAQDRAIIDAPGFATKAAAAALAAVNAVYGVADDVPIPPPVEEPVYATPQPVPLGTQVINGHLFVGHTETHTLAQDVEPRLWADGKSPLTGPDLLAGNNVNATHVTVGGDGEIWIVLVDGSRIPARSLVA